MVFTSIAKSEHVEKSRAALDTENANALEATLLGILLYRHEKERYRSDFLMHCKRLNNAALSLLN